MSGPNEPRIPEVESVVAALRQCGASALLASAQCSTVAHAFPPQSADRTAMRMLTDALAKAAADLTGAAVRASRLG